MSLMLTSTWSLACCWCVCVWVWERERESNERYLTTSMRTCHLTMNTNRNLKNRIKELNRLLRMFRTHGTYCDRGETFVTTFHVITHHSIVRYNTISLVTSQQFLTVMIRITLQTKFCITLRTMHHCRFLFAVHTNHYFFWILFGFQSKSYLCSIDSDK